MHRTRTHWLGALAILVLSGVATTHVLAAAVFPDVPDGHIHQEPIEQLVAAGVINGNPDGNFYPDRAVNRAEMLKMLYASMAREADPASVRCFPDVLPGSWYESYVCDAAANRFVAGYADGTFRPAESVNRVEALKMIAEVFGLNIPEISDYDRDVINFVDVSTSAWYTKYLSAAYETGILPIAGQDSSRFYPDWPLTRSEAAAYIYNALRAAMEQERQQAEAAESSSSAAPAETSGSESESEPEPEPEPEPASILEVDFPFSGGGKFHMRRPFSYRFWINQTVTAATEASLQSGQSGQVNCTLYLLEESGLSEEYYLGTKQGTSCSLLTTLTPGYYQLQLQPTQPDTTYKVTADVSAGDGNDGFSEAVKLTTAANTQTLVDHNYQNWYTFQVEDGNAQRMMVELTNTENVGCIVYAMHDVDLYGFVGPQCNEHYNYPSGTYYVAVTRKTNKMQRETYTIRLTE